MVMRYVRAYLSVFLWMLLIFVGSTDVGSARNTSRFIGPILRWFKPDVTNETIRAVQAVVRKSAHVTVYAVLAALIWRARRILDDAWSRWSWRESCGILAFCVFYAISDEIHQTFVSSRQGHPLDVLFDSSGAVIALLIVRSFVTRMNNRKQP
jgi:VanZ family protein